MAGEQPRVALYARVSTGGQTVENQLLKAIKLIRLSLGSALDP